MPYSVADMSDGPAGVFHENVCSKPICIPMRSVIWFQGGLNIPKNKNMNLTDGGGHVGEQEQVFSETRPGRGICMSEQFVRKTDWLATVDREGKGGDSSVGTRAMESGSLIITPLFVEAFSLASLLSFLFPTPTTI